MRNFFKNFAKAAASAARFGSENTAKTGFTGAKDFSSAKKYPPQIYQKNDSVGNLLPNVSNAFGDDFNDLLSGIDVELEEKEEAADIHNAVHAVVDPIINANPDKEIKVIHIPHVTTQKEVEDTLNGGRGICVFDRHAIDSMVARGESIEFKHANSTVYLGAKRIDHQENQELIYGDRNGYGIILNPDRSTPQHHDVRGIGVVANHDPQEIKPGFESRNVRSGVDFQESSAEIVEGTFSANCEFQLPYEPSTAVGPVPHSLRVNWSKKPYKSNENLHTHGTSRLMIVPKNEKIKKGLAITCNKEGTEFYYSEMEPGDVVVLGKDVWHTFAPVITKEHLQQPEESKEAFKARKANTYLSLISLHMDHPRIADITMSGPDTYFSNIENDLLIAVRNGDLSRVQHFMNGEKPFTKVEDGVLYNVTIPEKIQGGKMLVTHGKDKGKELEVVALSEKELLEAIKLADSAKKNESEIRDVLLQKHSEIFPSTISRNPSAKVVVEDRNQGIVK